MCRSSRRRRRHWYYWPFATVEEGEQREEKYEKKMNLIHDEIFTQYKNHYIQLSDLITLTHPHSPTHLICALYRRGHAQIRQPVGQFDHKQVRVCAVARGKEGRHGQLIAVVRVGQATAPQLLANAQGGG